jgi:dihydroxyacid dehydratase/phosphogluconate dehydratase
VDENSVLVMKNCGPKGYPGMAEVGNMGLPPKLLAKGIKDMVRISDARMSGTAYGTVVLHVAPEAMAGGPLGIVKDGDFIELDCKNGRLHLDVSDEEIKARLADRAENQKEAPRTGRGLRLRLPGRLPRFGRAQAFPLITHPRGHGVPTLRARRRISIDTATIACRRVGGLRPRV